MTPEINGGVFPYDYCYLWAAGKIALSGGNIYDVSLLSDTMYRVGWPQEEGIWGFTHPPWTLWLYLPFSLFPFSLARILWLIFLFMLFAVIVHHGRRLHSQSRSLNGKLESQFILFALLLFPGVIKVFAFGQSSFLLALGLLLFLRYTLIQRSFAAGMALSITLLKPHLLIPFYCAVFVNMAMQCDWTFFRGIVIGFLIQLAVSVLVYPSGFFYFLELVPHLVQSSNILPGTTIGQIFARYLNILWMRPVLLIAGIIIGTIAGTKREFSALQTAQWSIPLSLLVAPYCFSHEFVLLIPSYIFVLGGLVDHFGYKVRYAIFGMALAMVFVLVNTRFEFVTLLLPVFLLLAAVSMQKDWIKPKFISSA